MMGCNVPCGVVRGERDLHVALREAIAKYGAPVVLARSIEDRVNGLPDLQLRYQREEWAVIKSDLETLAYWLASGAEVRR